MQGVEPGCKIATIIDPRIYGKKTRKVVANNAR